MVLSHAIVLARALSTNNGRAIFPHLGFMCAPAAHPKFALPPYFILVKFDPFFYYVPGRLTVQRFAI